MVNMVSLSKDGPLVSQLIQGYWRLAEWDKTTQECVSFLKEHIDLGITTVDHADIYGRYQCERLFGEALSLDPSLRQQLQIITKCGINLAGEPFSHRSLNHYNSGRQHIIDSVERSLHHFHTDYLDVLLIHRPDFLMDADEVAEAFLRLHQQGKVRHFGVSNFSPSQFDLLQSRCEQPLVTNQVEINPLNLNVLDNGTLDHAQMHRFRPMAWSCLAGGSILNGHSERYYRLQDALHGVAMELGVENLDKVIYAWVRQLPAQAIPLLGTGRIERVRHAVASLDLELTHEQWYQIWTASQGHGVP